MVCMWRLGFDASRYRLAEADKGFFRETEPTALPVKDAPATLEFFSR